MSSEIFKQLIFFDQHTGYQTNRYSAECACIKEKIIIESVDPHIDLMSIKMKIQRRKNQRTDCSKRKYYQLLLCQHMLQPLTLGPQIAGAQKNRRCQSAFNAKRQPEVMKQDRRKIADD